MARLKFAATFALSLIISGSAASETGIAALDWKQTSSLPIAAGKLATIRLTPCPAGIDTTSRAGYDIFISGGGKSEAARVVSGSCVSGAASGTIAVVPFFSYASGAAIGSASTGIQEAINLACGIDKTTYLNTHCNVAVPPDGPASGKEHKSSLNTYNVYGTIYLHANQSVLNGYGVSLNCLGRGACLQVGDLKNSNDYTNTTVLGLSFRAPVDLSTNPSFAGVAIAQTQRTSQVVTVSTGSAHGFRVGDMVTILFTDSSAYWGDAIVTAVPNATTFQYAHAGADLAAQTTPGVVALAYVAILDNAVNTNLADISYDKVGENGKFNNFFDLWDDENVTITHFNNNAISLNGNANWTGSFVFSAGNQAQQIAPVITLRDSSITANTSNGVTVSKSYERMEEEGLWTPTLRDVLIERWLNIRGKTSQETSFRLNRAQREYSRRCGKKNIVLKARQLGVTTYVAARFFLETITKGGTVTLQVAQDRESAEDIFRIVHRFWDGLPEDCRNGTLATSRSNARQLAFPHLDSEYLVASAAENAGRGITIQNLHCSEVARWGRGGEEVLASLRAAVVPGGEIVMESTPNGAGGLFYDEWQRANETGYEKHFFPWWFEPSYRMEPGSDMFPLAEDEIELVKNHGIDHRQLSWRRKQRSLLRKFTGQEFGEDDVSCFLASGDCVFDLEAVERALSFATEPLESRDNGRFMTWLPARPGREYVIGVDPAGGGAEGDYSCAEVIDREMGAQCAELRGHYPPREFARKLVELGREYNCGLIAVERNNHGHAVLALLHTLDYSNIYVQKGQDGWLTSAVSRPVMIENLALALAEDPAKFRSLRLLNECRTFVRGADGNTGAAAGTHDDCVMALAIAWEVRRTEAGRTRSGPRWDALSNS